jgi:TonB family protein
VLVTVSLDATGAVQQASVLRSSGHAEFDSAALNAARAERFAPATRDGKPVPYTLSYTYHFRIED